MKTPLSVMLLALALGACSTPTQHADNPNTLTVVPTSTSLAVTQMMPSSSPVGPSTLSALRVENLNPINRVVTLSDLDLNPTTRILVFDPVTEQILSISDQSMNPIPNIQSQASIHLDGIEMSPDHHWFAYLVIDDGFNIWVSSVDGSQHFAAQTKAIGSSFRWVGDDKIASYHTLGYWFDCPNELQIIDPFSREVNDIPYISNTGSPYCFPIPYFNSIFSRAIYLNSEKGWEMYDYESLKTVSVLPGLDTSPTSNKYFFYWGKEGLTFAIPYSDKITFVRNLPESDLTLESPIETIPLPHSTFNENEILEFWIPNKQLAGFDLVGTDKNSILGCDIPKTFVIVNLATKELRNYCLDRSMFSNQIGTAWFTYTSADHRFVGWTVLELPSNDKPIGSVILDSETGKVSYLEGYEFLGFSEIGP